MEYDVLHFYGYDCLDENSYIYDPYYPFSGEVIGYEKNIDWDNPIFAVGKVQLSPYNILYII